MEQKEGEFILPPLGHPMGSVPLGVGEALTPIPAGGGRGASPCDVHYGLSPQNYLPPPPPEGGGGTQSPLLPFTSQCSSYQLGGEVDALTPLPGGGRRFPPCNTTAIFKVAASPLPALFPGLPEEIAWRNVVTQNEWTMWGSLLALPSSALGPLYTQRRSMEQKEGEFNERTWFLLEGSEKGRADLHKRGSAPPAYDPHSGGIGQHNHLRDLLINSEENPLSSDGGFVEKERLGNNAQTQDVLLLTVQRRAMGQKGGAPFPETGHRTPDTGHRTPDTGHRTPDTGYRILDTASYSGGENPEGRNNHTSKNTRQVISPSSPSNTIPIPEGLGQARTPLLTGGGGGDVVSTNTAAIAKVAVICNASVAHFGLRLHRQKPRVMLNDSTLLQEKHSIVEIDKVNKVNKRTWLLLEGLEKGRADLHKRGSAPPASDLHLPAQRRAMKPKGEAPFYTMGECLLVLPSSSLDLLSSKRRATAQTGCLLGQRQEDVEVMERRSCNEKRNSTSIRLSAQSRAIEQKGTGRGGVARWFIGASEFHKSRALRLMYLPSFALLLTFQLETHLRGEGSTLGTVGATLLSIVVPAIAIHIHEGLNPMTPGRRPIVPSPSYSGETNQGCFTQERPWVRIEGVGGGVGIQGSQPSSPPSPSPPFRISTHWYALVGLILWMIRPRPTIARTLTRRYMISRRGKWRFLRSWCNLIPYKSPYKRLERVLWITFLLLLPLLHMHSHGEDPPSENHIFPPNGDNPMWGGGVGGYTDRHMLHHRVSPLKDIHQCGDVPLHPGPPREVRMLEGQGWVWGKSRPKVRAWGRKKEKYISIILVLGGKVKAEVFRGRKGTLDISDSWEEWDFLLPPPPKTQQTS